MLAGAGNICLPPPSLQINFVTTPGKHRQAQEKFQAIL